MITVKYRSRRYWWNLSTASLSGLSILGIGRWVIRYKVDLAFYVFQKICKMPGIIGGIVDPLDQNIFERDPGPFCSLEIPGEIHDLSDRVQPVDGHKHRPGIIVGCIERDGEDRRFRIEHCKPVDKADGRESNFAVREIETVLVLENIERSQYVLCCCPSVRPYP